MFYNRATNTCRSNQICSVKGNMQSSCTFFTSSLCSDIVSTDFANAERTGEAARGVCIPVPVLCRRSGSFSGWVLLWTVPLLCVGDPSVLLLSVSLVSFLPCRDINLLTLVVLVFVRFILNVLRLFASCLCNLCSLGFRSFPSPTGRPRNKTHKPLPAYSYFGICDIFSPMNLH